MQTFRELISRNFGIKAASLILATMLWFYARSQCIENLNNIRIPVTIIPPASDMAISLQDVEFVIADISAPAADIRRLAVDRIMATHRIEVPADAKEITFKREIKLSPSDFNIPANVHIRYTPNTLSVTFEKRETTYVQVEAVVQGEPLDGYYVESVFTEPNDVLVSGAVPLLKSIDKINTMPVNIAGRTGYINRKVKINSRIEKRNVQCEDMVTVYITIKEKKLRKRIENIPIRVLIKPGSQSVYTLDKQTIGIDIETVRDRADKLSAERFSAYVNALSLSEPGEYKNVPVLVDGPKNIVFIGTPSDVTVSVATTQKIDMEKKK